MVQRLIANARKIHKAEPTIIQPILSLAPYRASLEYRTATGPAAVHEKEAELFYVIEGSGTLTTGGKLTDEKRQNPTNLGGTGIDGGQSRTVSKGDFLIVPEGSPHQYSDIKGELIPDVAARAAGGSPLPPPPAALPSKTPRRR